MRTTERRTPKYQTVYRTLLRQIESGRWQAGDRLPSEAELGRTFAASRITIGRALHDLQRAGWIERRAGSGTYVKGIEQRGGLSFGLLIPDLGETEIFEPICQGMMSSPHAREHALLWGSNTRAADSKAERARELCQQYIERKVAGVFFAPLELTAHKDAVNREIAQAFDDAGIPMVLLDRTVLPYPERGHHDLVGIDNRRAGYVVTEHLLRLGCRRIAFVGMANSAATVATRAAGYREALYHHDCAVDPGLVHWLDPRDRSQVEQLMHSQPDGMVCANDWTAARLMHMLIELRYAIPKDVRLVSIDDLEYAKLLPVPLTTLRQPTREIGAAALTVMLERLQQPAMAPRDVLLHGQLVVRRSCGAEAQ